jgi:Glycosyltransferase family 28 C-terminal domain
VSSYFIDSIDRSTNVQETQGFRRGEVQRHFTHRDAMLARMQDPSIELVYFNAGGGHRAAAAAIEAVVARQGRPWRVTSVNLLEVLDPQNRFKQATGVSPESLYNMRLARGWTLGLAQELKVFQGMIRLGHSALVKRLTRHWSATEPDMVVSLIPNFNRAMYEAVATALPGVPYVTILTDMADHPPSFWMEAGQNQHLVCGTPRAVAQARGLGFADHQIHPTSGMILRPDFYEPVRQDRRQQQAALGLDPDRPVGLVMFGGHGSMAMQGIAKELADVQLIFMCGHNKALATRLRAMKPAAAQAVVEFTPDVKRFMQLADFFIGKPGPGSLSEAVQQGLPIITVRNAATMPQERYNTEWVRENQLGLISRSMSKLRPSVLELLGRLDEFKRNVACVHNRAIFEVPDILAHILAKDLAQRPEGLAAGSN